jgi:hypothetical protein
VPYRVYLRWRVEQRVTEKTVTEDREEAERAYARLVDRHELAGQDVAVSLTKDGRNMRYFDFRTDTRDPKKPRPDDWGNR